MQLRCRYLIDLLLVFAASANAMQKRELRQFMPPASLNASIGRLIDIGAIEQVDSLAAIDHSTHHGRIERVAGAGRRN